MAAASNILFYILAGALALSVFILVRLGQEYFANLKFQRFVDPLTSLPNRLGFEEKLARLLPSGPQNLSGPANPAGPETEDAAALFFIGLDGFRQVNDLYSHRAGDAFLQQIGLRIRACLRRGDILARVGGDEFAVVTRSAGDRKGVAAFAETILAAVRSYSNAESHHVSVPASIGISMFPRDGRDPLTLIRLADLAMRRSKQRSGDTFSFYQSAMRQSDFRTGEIVALIRSALNERRLHLVFQPVVDREDAIAQVEALVRIQDARMGRIPPDEFIGVAEQTGLIHEIGAWILSAVVEQARAWHDAGYRVPIAINVSPVELQAEDFARRIIACLAAARLPASVLLIEITESGLLHREERSKATLTRLRKAGIRVSLGDCNAAASPGPIRNLPVDIIKLDGSSMARRPGDPALPNAIAAAVEQAHRHGCKVVFERIEEPSELEFARRSGCDLFQGFLIAPPLEAEDATQFLASHAEPRTKENLERRR